MCLACNRHSNFFISRVQQQNQSYSKTNTAQWKYTVSHIQNFNYSHVTSIIKEKGEISLDPTFYFTQYNQNIISGCN